ncbi:MAG: TrkH family potassium uptake protein [Trueperaceae bacterium]|nr:MAG: TrkH family potassium uptake protein [Trueperaceae bacterium]
MKSSRDRFTPFVLGTSLIGLSLVMLLFTLYALLVHDPFLGFVVATALAAVLGVSLRYLGAPDADPSRRETIATVLLIWFAFPLIGAIPYLISGHLSALNAFFEAMSGFTTTGSTVITDFENFPQSLFLWRALTQWVGGIGILVLFISVLPHLAIAGRQLFIAEAPGPTSETLGPRVRHTATAVLSIYIGLTVACCLAYILGGMSIFDAVAHSFTTLAAGGFSPNALSFADYNAALSWIAVPFMAFAGTNFALLYRAFQGRPRLLLQSLEFRIYLTISVVIALLMAVNLSTTYGLAEALRHGFFQSLSIITTTGFASIDFAQWPQQVQIFIVFLMFIGGSAGSAAGGIKVVRWLIVLNGSLQEARHIVHPRGVFFARLNGQVIPPKVMQAVEAFFTLYFLLVVLSSVLLVGLGADFITALTASLASVGNIGPGLAGVGPLDNFAELSAFSRGILIFDMYAGRLEIITVFLLFESDWWHVPHHLFRGSDS